MKYTENYFIKKFKAIPKNRWHEGDFWDSSYEGDKDGMPQCALGHCGADSCDDEWFSRIPEAEAVEAMFLGTLGMSVMSVNDDSCLQVETFGWKNEEKLKHFRATDFFPQDNPKDRVLAALNMIKEIKAMGKKKKRAKERIVYVSVPVEVIEESKQLLEAVN